MNKNLFKWLEALRSGQYQQGKGAMQTVTRDGTSRFCCLGVLCDVLKDDLDLVWDTEHPQNRILKDRIGTNIFDNGHAHMPPCKVVEAIPGLTRRKNDKVNLSKLVHMNDQQGMTFIEIADFLEEKLG